MKWSLPEFAVRRPVTIFMLLLSLFGVGVIAALRLPLTFLPRAESPFVLCVFPFPGAAPAQVEQQIAIPVEGEFRTIPGLSRIETYSTSDGCQVNLLFRLDADMAAVTGEIRDRIERLKPSLPRETDPILVQRFNVDSFPVMVIGMFSHGDREAFDHQVRTVMEPQLRRLNGVANIEIYSPTPPREILVEFEQDALRARNLSVSETIQALADGSMNLSLGRLSVGDTRYYVRYQGEYRSLESIAALVVGPGGLRLRDVASVNYRTRGDELQVSLDGDDGLIVMVTKESQANTVATCRAVREELARLLKEPAFEGATAHIFFDQSEFISLALNNLFKQGVYGAVMAIAVLFLFIHRLLPTALVAMTIPASLLFALVFMYFTGMSLNIITMVSMIIAVGMLVDNAIVVVENILRHRAEGHAVREAIIKGANEVGLAIFASTVTTWVVFLPMFYMQVGQMSVFMRQMGGPLFASLGGSLLVALTAIPLAMGALERFSAWRRKAAHAPTRRDRIFSKVRQGVENIISGYAAMLDICLRRRWWCLAGMAALIVITVRGPLPAVGMRTLPKLDMREITMDVLLDPNYTPAKADAVFATIEGELNRLREALAIKNIMTYYGREGGALRIILYNEYDGPRGVNPPYTTDEVVQILSQKIPMRFPGGEIRLETGDIGDPGGAQRVRVRLLGDEMSVLAQYAPLVAAEMQEIEDIRDVETDLEQGTQEVQVHIDTPLAQQAGVSPLVIAQTVDAALRGVRLPFLKHAGREVPVWAQFREEDRRSQANLDMISVPGLGGRLTPLQQLTEFRKAPGADFIRRVDGKSCVTIRAQTDMRNLMAVQGQLRNMMDRIPLPPMYSMELGDEFEELQENLLNFSATLLMAVILIYLVMCALFESFVLPFSILTTVPFSLVGAVWMLYFTGTSFDSISLIGCILMAGVIVNNGIVIVDHIRTLCGKSRDRHAAMIQAGKDRFRPVMMTTITTILGLLPVALARTGGSATFAGLGRALIGGMLVGTILTLFVVPIAYGVLDDFSSRLRAFWRDISLKQTTQA